jgi:lipopolysaccharide transport system ATP-binding protein
MNDIAIKVENLSKYYRLGVIKAGTIKDDFQSWFFKALGKEDPNKKLDSKEITDKGFWALKDINFEIKKGDRVGIIGKNGAGKSTLLKMISRISAPTEGRIYINGRVASLLEVGTGFNPELTGRENIYLNGAILGMKRKEVDRKIDEIIAFSDIEQHIDTPVKRYSSGMYVRLAFAVAAHLDSDILIADEVLAVGDAGFQKKALGKMNELSTGEGRTVLFVSHQIPAISALCNKGMFLESGRLIENGSLENSIDLYFNKKNKQDVSFWTGNIENQHLKITKASLTKDSTDLTSYASTYERGNPIFLNLDYEIFDPKQNYVLAINILNNMGNKICANAASDSFSDEVYAACRTIGKHSIQLKIDTSIFASGFYNIKFDISIHNIVCFTENDPSLNFTIESSNVRRVELIASQRQNVINPDWEWKLL